MSGGHFDYKQGAITEIVENLEHTIPQMVHKIPDKYGYTYDYSDETIETFKTGLKALKVAYIYAQRIDWLLSCDDGEDSYHERLNKELGDV